MIVPWTEIEGFHNIRKFVKAYPDLLNGNPKVNYRAKVKLHGTNAGIQCHHDGKIVAQSRTAELAVGSDNAGFAKWVAENEEAWKAVAIKDIIIFGEWCGPGIQKGVAINSIPNKIFAVFAARLLDPVTDLLFIEPEMLQALVKGIPNTHVLPWYNDATIQIDWNSPDEVLIGDINKWVLDIEQNDPWVQETFGVKGVGEGLVFYPVSEDHLNNKNFNNLCFKAKGEKHKNIATAAPVQLEASVAASIDAFVDMVLTPARLEQGAKAVGEGYEAKLTGKFVNWITADVEKETQDELEASKLVWKDVVKPLTAKARTWYLAESKK